MGVAGNRVCLWPSGHGDSGGRCLSGGSLLLTLLNGLLVFCVVLVVLFAETDWPGIITSIGVAMAAIFSGLAALWSAKAKAKSEQAVAYSGEAAVYAARADAQSAEAKQGVIVLQETVKVVQEDITVVKVQSNHMKDELVAAVRQAASLAGEKTGRAELKAEQAVEPPKPESKA